MNKFLSSILLPVIIIVTAFFQFSKALSLNDRFFYQELLTLNKVLRLLPLNTPLNFLEIVKDLDGEKFVDIPYKFASLILTVKISRLISFGGMIMAVTLFYFFIRFLLKNRKFNSLIPFILTLALIFDQPASKLASSINTIVFLLILIILNFFVAVKLWLVTNGKTIRFNLGHLLLLIYSAGYFYLSQFGMIFLALNSLVVLKTGISIPGRLFPKQVSKPPVFCFENLNWA